MAESINYMQRIKAVQDILRKDSLQKYYQSAILGLTILKRLCQEFEPKREEVKRLYDSMAKSASKDEEGEPIIDKSALMSASGLGYYNVSGIAFDKTLVSDPSKTFNNIKNLINGFSENVAVIFNKKGLDLVNTCSVINDKKALEEVLQRFIKLDLSHEQMDNAAMGAFFSQLVVMVYGTPENGENWTPSDFVQLLTRLLLAEGCDHLKQGYHRVYLLDNAVGSGQLTSYFAKYLTDKEHFSEDNEVVVCGQDNSDLNIAVCKAEQIMLGQKPDNFRVGSTLTTDCFPEYDFHFLIQNAPYGEGRKKTDEKEIKELLGEDLPASGDNQMLFWKAGLRKLKDGGRAALLSNGSPLFSGSTLSGESKIRKWLFDNDYVEAIIKLTDQGFLDTGISIYAWILNKGKKPDRRKGIIQIIDASSFYHTLRKGIGQKRKEMTTEDIDKIVELYTSMPKEETCEYVKYMTKEDFYYREITIYQPYQRNYQISDERIQNLYSQKAFNSLWDEEEYERLLDEDMNEANLLKLRELDDGKNLQSWILDRLSESSSGEVYVNRDTFTKKIKELFPNLKPNLIKSIVVALSEKDKTSDTYPSKKTKSGLESDPELNDSEFVPFKETVRDYFNREVKPFAPDSWYEDADADDKTARIGCEVNFTKYFYKYVPLRDSDTVLSEIQSITNEERNLLADLELEGAKNSSFKKTNIKWMPEIPQRWERTKIGSNCYLKGRIGWQGLTADEYQDAGPFLITGTDFDKGGINWNTCVHITERRYVEASHIRVKNGDVLITKDGTVGKVAIVENMPDKASLNSGVMLMRNLKGQYENKYLYYVLCSNVFWDWFYREKKENSTIIHLYQEQFEKFSFPLPSKNEQLQIADYLDKKCAAIDKLIELKKEKIEKLKEYKKSLLYEFVTGRRIP